VRGEGGEWSARVRSGEGPSAGAFGLEFPSKGIRRELWNSLRREFEGNSKGTLEFPSKGIRRELEGCWKYYASCRAHPATMRTVQNLGLGGCKTRSFIGTTTTGSSLVHCKLCCISSCARNVHFNNELPCDAHTQP